MGNDQLILGMADHQWTTINPEGIQRQLDYMASALTKVEEMSEAIDLQEFGRLQAEVASLRRDADRLLIALEAQTKSLQSIESQLAEARGGWKTLMLVGGAAGAIGAGTVKILSFIPIR